MTMCADREHAIQIMKVLFEALGIVDFRLVDDDDEEERLKNVEG